MRESLVENPVSGMDPHRKAVESREAQVRKNYIFPHPEVINKSIF